MPRFAPRVTERDVTDLLTPEKVREWQRVNGSLKGGAWFNETIDRLCRDYITLWDELEYERELHDNAVKRVTELEQMMGALGR